VRRIAAVAVVALLGSACGGGTDGHSRAEPQTRATATTSSSAARESCALATTRPTASTRRITLRRVPTAAAPLRTLLVGDSIATTLGPSFVRGAELYGAHTSVPQGHMETMAGPGFGFTSWRPGVIEGRLKDGFAVFRHWPALIDAAIARHDPDVVLVLVGSWDIVPRVVGDRLLGPGDCAWPSWYRRLTETAWRHLTSRGARVLWLAFPCTKRSADPAHYSLNHVLRSLADAHPTSTAYLDLDGFACPDGVPVHSMRAPDGSLHAVRGGDDAHFDFDDAWPVLGPWVAQQFRQYLTTDR
jgi:hypothetical protein